MRTRILTITALFTQFSSTAQQLVSKPVALKKGISFNLKIPQGHNIAVAAEGMGRLRFLAKSPDGRLFATDMYDKSDNRKGKIYLFAGWDNGAKRFNRIVTFASGLHNPNQVAFYTAKGKHYIYIAETDKLSRYDYVPGDMSLRGKGTVIAIYPDYGLSYKYGGWHLTRSIAINNDKLYVSVGSSCNACVEKEPIRATIQEMNPDGSNKRLYATGLRNSVGIKWVNGKLYATAMGRDLIGPDKPEDMFMTVEPGKFYGWPYYYQYKQQVYPDKDLFDSARKANVKVPGKPPVAYCGFKAHVAPLGLDYFANYNDPQLKDAFLVALHGSTSVWRQRGNSLVKIAGRDKYVDIVSGFLQGKTEKERYGRPCDVMMWSNNSFFFTDDHNGVLYYVWK